MNVPLLFLPNRSYVFHWVKIKRGWCYFNKNSCFILYYYHLYLEMIFSRVSFSKENLLCPSSDSQNGIWILLLRKDWLRLPILFRLQIFMYHFASQTKDITNFISKTTLVKLKVHSQPSVIRSSRVFSKIKGFAQHQFLPKFPYFIF